jgi:hypothetical protein
LLQDAIDTSVPGDIIQVIPSPDDYGNVTINTANAGISIFGIGFIPDKDWPAKSSVNQILVYASNIRISGLRVTSFIQIGQTSTVSQTISNISTENSDINFISSSADTDFVGSNILIRNCFVSLASNNTAISLSNRISNSVITNCIIGGATATTTGVGSIICHNSGVIKNNVFFGDGETNKNAFSTIENCTVSNNIFFGREPQAVNLVNVTFNNNVSVGADNNTLPPKTTDGITGNNNFTTLTDATLVFDDPAIVIGDTWDFNWVPTLSATNAAILLDAGTDGTNIGPTGSTLGWDPTGVPLPLIQSVISSEVIKQGDNLDVTIKARGN